MRIFAVLVFVVIPLSLASFGWTQPNNPHIASTPPLAPEEQLKKFHLPPGFVIELVAAEPKVKKPINIAFDAQGRLWVTESVEYPFPAKDRKGTDTVKILSDFAKNGLAGKIVTFADDLNIPIGVLPTARGALVYAIPNIMHLSEPDPDGKAANREVLYTGYGFQDTHGMTGEFVQGFDGWIYACHGYANTSKVKAKTGESITMQSGNTYRFKADGSKIEQFTWGQVNPFGLTLDELGNLYSCDCHSRPIYQLLKGAYYPSFGKPHDGLGYGPEMMQHDHGSTAIAGIAYYFNPWAGWPQEYMQNIFIGNVVTNRINRDRIEWHGTTPKAVAMPDFVKCDDPWFRPVDIKAGTDGNLYVADFYTPIIGHYEVPLDHPKRDRDKGRIWRIRYVGEKTKVEQRALMNFTKFSNVELAKRLSHIDLTTHLAVLQECVNRGGPEIVKLAQKEFAEGAATARAGALWVLERLGQLDDKTLATAATTKPSFVRIHAMRVLAERQAWRDGDRALAVAGLTDDDPFVQRCAAEALGAHPAADNVVPLLEMRHKVPAKDTHLLHVVRMALRDQLRPEATWKSLKDKKWEEKDARALADVSLGVPSGEAAGFLLAFVERWNVDAAALQRHSHHITRHGIDGSASKVMKLVRAEHGADLVLQSLILKTLHQATQERGGKLGKEENELAEALSLTLLTSEPAHVLPGIDLAGTFRVQAATPVLLATVTNPKIAAEVRGKALVALLAIEPQKNTAALARLLNSEAEPLTLREEIARSLAATNRAEAHAVLTKALETAPAKLQSIIAQGLAGSGQGAEQLLQTVAAGKASPRLLQDRALEVRLEQTRVPNLKERLAKLTRGLPAADKNLQELLGKRKDSFAQAKVDVEIGKKLFVKHCASCHQIANQGSKIGPQLDGIGSRGLERLLEDVLDPNCNVDQAFRATTLALDNGRFVTGLFLRQDGKVLILADTQGKEVRVPEDQVQEKSVNSLSPMPSDIALQMPEAEFHHLMAYLLAQRVKE